MEFVKDIQSHKRLSSLDEAALKQGVILRILSYLGWDPFNIDEIHPEYSVENGKVDFSLMHNNSNKVFVGAKKVGVSLEKHQDRLLSYSLEYGVKIALLTNGITWWFSLPLIKGDWEDKRFHTFDMYEQDAEEITQILEDLLSKKNVVSGKALKNAESLYERKQSTFLIRETLPKVWNLLMSNPEDWLVDIMAEATEKLCGFKPDKEIIEEFLISDLRTKTGIKPSTPKRSLPPKPTKTSSLSVDYTGKSIVSFMFKGKRYDVSTWNAMLLKICNVILDTHKDRFEYVLTLIGPKRPYFSKNPNELLNAEKIPGTDIYVEVNIGAMGVVRLCKKILKLFGNNESDLSIKVK